MSDSHTVFAIFALGVVSYALRSGGFLGAGLVREDGSVARFLRLAPGNLFIAFVTAACVEGGWPSVIGSAAALVGMAATEQEWVALTAGFSAAAVAARVLG